MNYRFIFLALFSFFSVILNIKGQETSTDISLPKVGPPTPNATSLHVFGNNNVNQYTGTADIRIPIYEIKEDGVNLPIYLSYTGGNGIKVSEIASWVGLGWSLNTGGAVSRVKRGRADEDKTGGFFTLSDLPRLGNGDPIDDFVNICKGNLDGEPDSFHYNFPEGSGQFFFDQDKNHYLKPKKNIDLSFWESSVSGSEEFYSGNPVSLYHNVIDGFTIKSEQGNVYTFEEKEYSNSITYGIQYSDNRGFPSSWYISKINNPDNASEILFEYDDYRFETIILNGSVVNGSGVEEETYVQNTYIGKRLKKISFSQGSIEFNVSSANRKDLANEKYLESIVIKNNTGTVQKKFIFRYEYSTGSNFVDVNASLSVSSSNRLILKEVQEVGKNGETDIPPYIFTYNQDHFLPDRVSKSVDHWGYYNGKGNENFEPEYTFTWYHLTNGWTTEQFGSANREASPEYAAAGILNGIEYPTGGSTYFAYEGNQASNYNFQTLNPEGGKSTMLSFQNQKTTISIERETASSTNMEVEFREGLYTGDCYPEVFLENISTGDSYLIPFGSQTGNILSIDVPVGEYEVWFELTTNNGQPCTQEDPISVMLRWTNLISNNGEAYVGGVRIKSINDFSGNSPTSTRYFDYKNDSDKSSGVLLGPPKYAFLIVDNFTGDPVFYKRWAQSQYPLLTTQGSVVGYEKVSVSQEGSSNGLTEYYFTGPSDFPDVYHGTDENGIHNSYTLHEGKKIHSYPIAEVDGKDYLRGLLKLKNIYKKEAGQLSLIKSHENIYKNLYYNFEDLNANFQYLKDNTKIVEGLKVWSENCSGTKYFRYYHIYTGYSLLEKSITTDFSGANDIVETTTHTYYEDTNGIVDWFKPSYTSVGASENGDFITKTYYPRDVTSTSSLGLDPLTSAEKSAVDQLKASGEHKIATPIQVNKYKDKDKDGIPEPSELISSFRTNFSVIGSAILPDGVESLKGVYNSTSNKLDPRIKYERYDSNANPLEVKKVNGPSIVYIWGYNDQQPIAKIQNATTADVLAALSNEMGVSVSSLENIDESDLTAINALRNNSLLPDSQITTYTMEPLVGVTSVTDPKGQKTTYHYDNFNRLEFIRDENGNILKEYKYNYKQ